MKICSACGASTNSSIYHNSHVICPTCHDKLKKGSAIKTPYSNHTATDYPALRTISTAYRVLAVLTGIASVVLALIILNWGNIPALITVIISGIFGAITNLAIAEGILVFLRIETNTRKSSEQLEQLVKN